MSSESARVVRRETDANSSLQSVQVSPPPIPPGERTPEDSIVRACPPPIEESTADATDVLCRDDNFAFQFDGGEANHGARRDSAGWVSSFVVHCVLIALLGLLLAPADFGGNDAQTIQVTFSHDKEIERAARFEAPESDDAVQDLPLPLSDPLLMEVPLATVAAMADVRRTKPGISANPGSGSTGGDSGARGSFFGIEADGHEFVYVLDMSGSMRGVRFKRATNELIRSVEGLRETQNFYVLLFNGSTMQMFGGSSRRPTAIAATSTNKNRLSTWLNKAFRGGSTDPRGALRLALRMEPSAIFMLSDGEFDAPDKKKKANLLEGNSDTFAIVAAAAASVPIHAIAFEDPSSCKNMKRLAEMTKGEYRFKKSQDEELAKELLARARQARGRGDNATAEALMRQTITTFGNTRTSSLARKELAATLHESAEKAFKEGRLEVAKQSLLGIVMLDPQGNSTSHFQQALIAEFLKRSRQDSGRADASVISMLAEVVERYPRSKATQSIIGPVADGVMEQARELAANDQPGQSLLKLESIIRKYPHVSAVRECQVEQQKIIDEFLARGKELRRTDDVAASAKYYRDLLDDFDVKRLDDLATRELEEMAVEMLVDLRDATYQRDWSSRDEIKRKIEVAFAGHATFKQVQRNLGSKERSARDLLRRAGRFERTANTDNAIKRYVEIVEKHPETFAAKKAESRLSILKPKREPNQLPEGMSQELYEMMQP